MTQVQEESPPSSNDVFERLRRFQVTEGLTWKQVAKRLGTSVSTIMAVKAQTRKLGPKTLHRLDMAEREAAARKSVAETVVERLLWGDGSARELIEMETRRRRDVGIPVQYVDARRARALPQVIKLVCPAEEGCRRLRRMYADTLDAQIVLLACLPPENRTESFLSLLTPATRSRLQAASLRLAFGEDWRSKLAGLAVGGDQPKVED